MSGKSFIDPATGSRFLQHDWQNKNHLRTLPSSLYVEVYMPTQQHPPERILTLEQLLSSIEEPHYDDKSWVGQYSKWAFKKSPLTPYHFHQNIALTLAAGAIAGRCYVQLPHAKIFPNVYTLLLGRTSVLAKTTALDAGNIIVDLVMPDKVTDSVSTPEAMVNELSGAKPSNWDSLNKETKEIWTRRAEWGARKLFVLDEAGMLFNSLRRDYNATLSDLLMRLYDATGKPITRTTMGKGFVAIQKYALSCLFGTTPATLRLLLASPDAWTSGFWNRWNFATQEDLTEWRDAENIPPPRLMVETLRQVSNGWLCKYNEEPFSVPIDKSVETAFKESTKKIRDIISRSDDERVDGLLSRIPTKQMKAAIIFSILDNHESGHPRIKSEHWDICHSFAEGWRRDALIAISMAEKSDRISQEEKIRQLILRNAEGVTARMIQQHLRISAEDTRRVLHSLEEIGQIRKKTENRRILWVNTETS